MKLLSRDQIETLAAFKSDSFQTLSFFLDTKKQKKTKKEVVLAAKSLMAKAKASFNKMDLNKDKENSLHKDLKKISQFCSRELGSYKYSGLALFSCAGENFWQVFFLPNSPRNRVVIDKNPYIRPLSAIFTEYTRICSLIFDRKEAKWYDTYMGEIMLLDSLSSGVPSPVKYGGREGFESSPIEKHTTSRLKDYLKKTAQKTFSLYKKSKFDWLFLSCLDEYKPVFDDLLHPYLKDRLKGRFKASTSESPAKIHDKILKLKQQLIIQEKEEILNTFVAELKKGGLSVYGLKNTLKKVNRREVQTLLITRHFSKAGKMCPKCGFLFVDEAKCPSCRIDTDPVVDVVDEAIEAAYDKKCRVIHINPPSKLKQYGDIGAILRYKT